MSTAKPILLVVEDDGVIALDLEQIASGAGFEVRLAHSTYAAISVLASLRVEFVLLDVFLNGRPCYPLAKRLLASGIRFAFCSGLSGSALPAEFANIAIVGKPFTPEQVEAAISPPARSPDLL